MQAAQLKSTEYNEQLQNSRMQAAQLKSTEYKKHLQKALKTKITKISQLQKALKTENYKNLTNKQNVVH